MNALISMGFKKYFAYRANTIVRVLSSPISLIVLVLMWSAVFNYSGNTTIGGFTLSQMITYYVIVSIAEVLTASHAGLKLGMEIYDGTLAMRLLKPMKTYSMFFYEELGRFIGVLLVRAIPLMFLVVILFNIPLNPVNAALFLVSAVLSFIINFFIEFLFSLSFFLVEQYEQLLGIFEVLTMFFSGYYIPFNLLPGFLATIFSALPFAYTLYHPVTIFIGLPFSQVLSIFFYQLVWIVVLGLVLVFSWNWFIKRFSGVRI